MKKVLIFAGTTEGRRLVELFDRSGIGCHVCVATEYGNQVLKTSNNITVHTGRLSEEQMKELFERIGADIIIDATHPYATVVTSVIKKCVKATGIEYIRLLRKNDICVEGEINYYDDIAQCAVELSRLSGNILLTTGSKQLGEFTRLEGLSKRLIVRVIPGIESLKLCYEAGLEGSQIIAMQGPFSKEMNETLIREYKIEHLVTKESGSQGGVNEKILAARETGTSVHIIKRPKEDSVVNECNSDAEVSAKVNNVGATDKAGMSFGEVVEYIEKQLKVTFDKGKCQVTLAGIGPGIKCMMTKEVENAVKEADILFGAERMLDTIECRGKKYPYYLGKDIIPILEKCTLNSYGDVKAVVLFSGDTGFFSGCRKMQNALADSELFEVKVLPGISSISALSAKIGIDWQDAHIVSLHGTDRDKWEPDILDSVRYNEKTFFITSGAGDIRILGELVDDEAYDCEIYLGYRISYPDEEIMTLAPKECRILNRDGLYSGLIVNRKRTNRPLVPILEDEFFIREQVPMTKEEIRRLSLCQMKIKENDVIYDIGCGSGSIAVQAGMLSPSVRVYALDCNPDAVALTLKNIKKAKLHNITVTETSAPDGLGNLPVADTAFIGGSKGNLMDILLKLYEINPHMRVVVNAVSLETITEMNRCLKTLNICNTDISQVAVSKAKQIGDYNMLCANNPVYIFAFDFAG